jgi:hypothetical protein
VESFHLSKEARGGATLVLMSVQLARRCEREGRAVIFVVGPVWDGVVRRGVCSLAHLVSVEGEQGGGVWPWRCHTEERGGAAVAWIQRRWAAGRVLN